MQKQKCFCAFCKTERKVYKVKHISWTNVVLTFLLTVLFSIVYWQKIDPRAVLLFALGLGISELFIQLRWRLTLPCTHCGFDPVLYIRDPSLAANRVKNFLQQKAQDPMYFLSPNPLLRLNAERLQKQKQLRLSHKTGLSLSKQV